VPARAWLGAIAIFMAVLLFPAQAVMIKLPFGYPVKLASLLCLRMILSLPFFVAIVLELF